MNKSRTLFRIAEISKLRADAAERRLAAADAEVRAGQVAVHDAEKEAAETEAARDRLKDKARAAFMGSAQTANAVVRLIDNNRMEDQKTTNAWEAVQTARDALAEREGLREEARARFATLTSELDTRATVARKIQQVEQRAAESRADDALNDDRAAALQTER